MKHYAFEIICDKGHCYEVHGEAICEEVARRDVIASAIQREMWIKNICLLDVRLIDDSQVDEDEIESRENDDQL